MHKKLFLFIPLLFYLIGCSPFPVYRVSSLDNRKDLFMGIESVKKGDKTASVTLEFQKQSGKNYVFYITIKNNSRRQFLVDPKNIYTKPIQSKSGNDSTHYYALDPEHQLIKIDKEIKSTSAQKNTTNGLFFLTSVINLASDIATIGKKKSERELEQTQYDRDRQLQENIDENNYYNGKIVSLKDQKNNWEHNLFRVSIFYPGDEIGGYLILPIVQDADIIDIVVSVNNKGYNFIYKQTCID